MTDFFVHPMGLCETPHVGARTRIWAFAHVLPNARVGADCNICDHTFIENDVVVGDRVTIKCGVQLWDGVRIEDDYIITSKGLERISTAPREMDEIEREMA